MVTKRLPKDYVRKPDPAEIPSCELIKLEILIPITSLEEGIEQVNCCIEDIRQYGACELMERSIILHTFDEAYEILKQKLGAK